MLREPLAASADAVAAAHADAVDRAALQLTCWAAAPPHTALWSKRERGRETDSAFGGGHGGFIGEEIGKSRIYLDGMKSNVIHPVRLFLFRCVVLVEHLLKTKGPFFLAKGSFSGGLSFYSLVRGRELKLQYRYRRLYCFTAQSLHFRKLYEEQTLGYVL